MRLWVTPIGVAVVGAGVGSFNVMPGARHDLGTLVRDSYTTADSGGTVTCMAPSRPARSRIRPFPYNRRNSPREP